MKKAAHYIETEKVINGIITLYKNGLLTLSETMAAINNRISIAFSNTFYTDPEQARTNEETLCKYALKSLNKAIKTRERQ